PLKRDPGLVEDPRIRIGRQADRRADGTWPDLERVVRRTFDGTHAGIRLLLRIAVESIEDSTTTPEFAVGAIACIGVVLLDRLEQRHRIDADPLRETFDR